jgi:hypothetical protein
MSVLIREAAELLRTELSNDGQILDIAHSRDALKLLEASLLLLVNAWIRSRDTIKQLKSNGPLGELLYRLIIFSESGTVNSNAGDVFEAALKLEQLGTNLPENDGKICQ